MTIENNADALASGDDEALLAQITSGDDIDVGGEPPAPEPAPTPDPVPPAPEPAPAPAPAPEPKPETDAARHVPITALLDEREKRQALQRELEALKRQAQPPAPKPEFWEQPEEFVGQHVAPVVQQVSEVREYFSRKDAIRTHGEEVVSAAYQAMKASLDSGDAETYAAYQRIMASPDPFENLVQWNQRQEPIRNPDAYRQRLLDEALKDPAFVARAVESARAVASANPIVPPKPSTPALPSVSKAGTPAPVATEEVDLPDDELLATITRDERGRFTRR